MKKIIEKNINIITSSLIIVIFIILSLFSYQRQTKAQDEFVENSLSFFTFGEIDENKVENFKKSYKYDLLVKDEKEKVIYNTGIDKNIIKNYEFEDIDIVKKSKKNYLGYERKIFAKKSHGKIFAIEFYNTSFLLYLFKRIYMLIFAIIFALIINKFFTNSLYEKLINQFKEEINDKKDFEDLKDNPKKYLDKLINEKGKIEDENLKLKTRIANIEKITSNMEEGFIYFDKDGNIVIINDAAKNLLNINRDNKLDNLIDNEDFKLALRQTRLLKKGKNLDLDLEEISVKIFLDPVIDEEIVSYIVIVIDNSKNKKAEAMRREFSSNVSHELKSPLTSINGYAELIATGLAKDDDIKKFGQIINEEGNRLLNIIDDILKLSKLDEENLQEVKTIVNIKNVVDQSINRFKRISEMKNIKVENKVCDINIKTHESLFTDLVTNIYENAIKYNKTNGQIIIKCEKNKKNIKLIIEDRGIGIKKEDLPRIFERFYVADKQRTRTLKSTGLGLSIVKHICDYLNYDIKVESKYGYGSKFIILIPAL
ncbi:PAS domain-containing sensor histidine kinase [Anaerococcus vaginalis]|uniref:histidine kinase n=2 Tax=Anaerococcus vaginalis TaxID=33037 RepID=C7HSL9_9FIRM|nr:ATP-binding protein [Anaerococcus vaginalis]EEU13135.1 ATPase/histidine kinase/DNA gyrase B/HSP90 domain protein [Anaerococcus vaginalis ATCC 51170]QQB62338.1 PAS domain-containing sensor histidine kinase [Anaerococcus vaginalis]